MRVMLLALVLLAVPLAGCMGGAPPTADTSTDSTGETSVPDGSTTPDSGGDGASQPTPTPESGGEATPQPTPKSGPAWSLTDTDGDTYTRDAPDGKATVLFFMATWCSSCVGKTGIMRSVHADYASKDVRFLSVDFDPSESKAALENWKSKYDQSWPHGLDEGQQIQRTFGVRTQSTVVLLDAQGEVVKHWTYGRVTESELRSMLDQTLGA